MKVTNQHFSRSAKALFFATCVSVSVTGAAMAQGPSGGFQSNVSGGVVSGLSSTPGAYNFNGFQGLAGMPADAQAAFQALAAGGQGLSATDFDAADQCVSANSPNSPQAAQYHQALKRVTGEIAKVNSSAKGLLPGNGSVKMAELYQMSKASSDLRRDLMNLLQATNMMAANGSPQVVPCAKQTYDTIDKAAEALEKLAPSLKQAMKSVGL